jgi:uncharacterized membrane protein YdjX (TVP38/TMEM64 family)
VNGRGSAPGARGEADQGVPPYGEAMQSVGGCGGTTCQRQPHPGIGWNPAAEWLCDVHHIFRSGPHGPISIRGVLETPLATSRPPRPPGRGARVLLSPWARCALLAVLLTAAAAAVLAWDPQRLLTTGWPQQLTGIGAAAVFVAGFALCTLAFVPKPLLNAAAGALFGIQLGLPLAVAGTTLGAVMAFALGRGLGRDALRRLLRTKALTALDGQLSDHGFRSVLLMRLVPVLPFAVANYSAAISRMRCSAFAAATALGVVPTTAVYVVAGSHATTPDTPVFVASLITIAAMGLLSLAGAWRARAQRRNAA